MDSSTPAARRVAPGDAPASPASQIQPGGAAYAVAAYTIWGVAPLYFIWVAKASALEVLAHRILWAVPLLLILLFVTGEGRSLRALSARQAIALVGSSFFIALNWGVYIYAVQNEHIVETSLGYYLNPLINVALGVLLLAERLRRWQWVAIFLAAFGVANEVFALGQLPWIALCLACTFAIYGFIRKVAGIAAVPGLLIETLLILPFAAAYLLWAHAGGSSATARGDTLLLFKLALGGIITITPLLCFTAAALRMPLSILGFFQYLAPTLQLLLAVFLFSEPFYRHQFLTFGLIWLALGIFTVEGWRFSRRRVQA